ncbi:hypothetical protein KM043_010560 [Ampulex compressa]|nr:hypothetical protein KM043_010560 [Ampulex compressa]
MKTIGSIILSIIIYTIPISGADWGYSKSEQLMWPEKYKQCGGKMQSPIAISTSKAIPRSFHALEMIGYHDFLPGLVALQNNGHSVELRILNNSREVDFPKISGAVLTPGTEYEMQQFHFHWGAKNSRGSEHTVNGIRYPMEMHIVHKNKMYYNMSSALEHDDGVAVVAIFFHVQEEDNDQLSPIVNNLANVKSPNEEILLHVPFSLSSILPCHTNIYYTYKGSLTTPPCSEGVTWILFSHTVPISPGQMKQFRMLSTGKGPMVDNFRLLQDIGCRKVYIRKFKHNQLLYKPFDVSSLRWSC